MKTQKSTLTFKNIMDLKGFLETVDRCAQPVTLCLPDGSGEDLRRNARLQQILCWLAPDGKLPELKISAHDDGDLKRLTQYMMQSLMKSA